MKILIAFAHHSELSEFLQEIDNENATSSFKYKHITVDFVQTGYTVYETAFAMAKALSKDRYHLILYAGLAFSLNDKMKTGEVLNVINDIPFSIGVKNEHGFEHAYSLGWLDKTAKPHVRGAYVNMSNAYFNVFLPFMKTAALTSPQMQGDAQQLSIKTSKFQMHIESSNGIGFHYACLHEGMPFYQLRAVEKNVILKTENKELALSNLNKALIQIIDLL